MSYKTYGGLTIGRKAMSHDNISISKVGMLNIDGGIIDIAFVLSHFNDKEELMKRAKMIENILYGEITSVGHSHV